MDNNFRKWLSDNLISEVEYLAYIKVVSPWERECLLFNI